MDQPLESSQADDLTHALKHAKSEECRLWIARRLIAQREARGDYAMIQGGLTDEIREAMARVLVAQVKESKHE